MYIPADRIASAADGRRTRALALACRTAGPAEAIRSACAAAPAQARIAAVSTAEAAASSAAGTTAEGTAVATAAEAAAVPTAVVVPSSHLLRLHGVHVLWMHCRRWKIMIAGLCAGQRQE